MSEDSSNNMNELNKASNYVEENTKYLKQLSEDFKNASNLKLFYDSKIPEKDKAWYYFFDLTLSDRDDVLEKIKIYEDFYKEFCDLIKNIEEPEDTEDTDYVHQQQMLLNFNDKLSDMVEEAKMGENTTSSTAICELHRRFIGEHEKVENMVKRVELVVVTDGWKKSLQCIDTLRDEAQENEKEIKKMKEDIEIWVEKLEKQEELNEKLVNSNDKMRENLEEMKKLIEKRDREKLLESKKADEQQRELKKCIEQMKEEQLSESTKARKQQEELMYCIEKLQNESKKANERQSELLACINELKHQQDNLVTENAAIKMKLERKLSDPKSSKESK